MNHGDRCHIEIERRIPAEVIPIVGTFVLAVLLLTLSYFGGDVGGIYRAVLSNLKFWIGADLLTLAWVLSARLEKATFCWISTEVKATN